MITTERIVRDLATAGIAPSQRLIVHSSLRLLGKVKGGADAVINALMAVLGPHGTLVMPTFTFSMKPWDPKPYDSASSPSLVGQITDTFWRRHDVLRSDHPSHSFAAWGAHADEITADHRGAVGPGSPLGWLNDHGGLILQIGTDQATNTALHLCEEIAQVPYLDTAFTPGQSFEIAHRIGPDGGVEEVPVEPCPGSSKGFARVEPVLQSAGVVREVQIGEARTLITPMPALVGAVAPVLREHPGLLLSTLPDDDNGQARRLRLHRDPAIRDADLIDLYIEGFPGGQRLNWAEREAIAPAARRSVEKALRAVGADGFTGATAVRDFLDRESIRVELRDDDAFAFSLWEPSERTVRVWRGALERLAKSLGKTAVPCAQPLRGVGESELVDLALAHEAFHVLCEPSASSLQGRIVEELAARLFADALLQLPAPSLLIDVWLMHWAGDATAFAAQTPESL